MTKFYKSVSDMLQRSETVTQPLRHPYIETSEHDLKRALENNAYFRKRVESFTQMYSSDMRPELLSLSSFALLFEFLQKRANFANVQHGSVLLNVVTFAYQLSRSTTLLDYIAAMQTFSSVLGYSFFDMILKLEITDILSCGISSDSDNSSQLTPEGMFKDINDSWKLLRSNPIFPKISLALGCITMLPVLFLENKIFEVGIVKLLSDKLLELHVSAVDVVDALLESFTWICETGFAVISTGSLSPILYSDQSIREFNDKFLYVDAQKSNAINGSHPDIAKYRSDLNDCLALVERFSSCKLDFVMRRYLHDKYNVLMGIKDSLAIKDRNCVVRFAPIGFCLFGGTSVGKTTLSKLTMFTSLSNMGFSTLDEHQITLDMNDKYHSTLTNDIQGIYFDDLANSRAAFSQNGQVPSSLVIKFFNNVPGQAIKADVDDKGKVFISLKCGVITTNKKDLDAPIYSNCPESILRRLYHVTVRIKPKYALRVNGAPTTMLNTQHPDLIAQPSIGAVDVWVLDIQTVETSVSQNGTTSFGFQYLPVNFIPGKTHCQGLSLSEYLSVVAHLSKQHKIVQENLINGTSVKSMVCCATHSIPKQVCGCQGLEDFGWLWKRILFSFGYRPIAEMKPDDLYKFSLRCVDRSVLGAVPYIPECLLGLSITQHILAVSADRLSNFSHPFLDYFYSNHFMCASYCYILFTTRRLLFSYHTVTFTSLFINLVIMLICCQFLKVALHKAREKQSATALILATSSRGLLSAYSKHMRDTVVPRVLVAGGSFMLLVAALKYMYKVSLLPEANSLDSTEIERQPGWFGFLYGGGKNKIVNISHSNRSPSQMVSKVKKNLFFATFVRDDGSSIKCCLFVPRKCIGIIPKHVFFPEGNMNLAPSKRLTVQARRHASPGGCITIAVAWNSCSFQDDLCCFHIPNCPDVADISNLVCDSFDGAGWGEMVRRMPDCTVETENVYLVHGPTSHSYMQYYGSTYKSTLCGPGACMSPIISDSVPSGIVGLHIAGSGEKGSSIGITKTILQILIAEMQRKNFMVEGCDGELQVESLFSYGKPYVVGPVHSASHSYELHVDTCFQALGTTKFGRQSKSCVEKSILYDSVLKNLGIEDSWKAPDMLPNWKHYNLFIDKIVNPSRPFPPDTLTRAIRDYISPLRALLAEYNGIKRPLTLTETIDGVPGVRFMEPINLNTSMGFPVFGKKKEYFTVSNENGLYTRVPCKEVIDEYHRLIDCYRENKRGYPVFAACLKDEVKDKSSDKVRVFTACSVGQSMVLRQYFLPIIAFLGRYPRESEMAVGVNAFGLQWQDLIEHAEKFSDSDGGDIGMDYSSYDTRMNSQVSRSAFSVLINLAIDMGYHEDDIRLMNAMVDDVTHPLVDINGTLYALQHINCSGNNITVQINCIANSLYLRLAFFHFYPKMNYFRNWVSITTYGDDNKGSVKHECRPQYNFQSIRSYFLEHDIKITSPDKSDGYSKDFFAREELDFLKRSSNYIPEINRKLGKLDEASILKSLCYNLHSSSATPREVAASCIDTALHEWFAYGRDHYETRRSQLRHVCKDVGMENYPILDIAFDERVVRWKEKYLSDTIC